ncbi:hypothetical protein Hanom_Chr00s000002g01601021 [Helianthus anomalus]
MSSQAGASGAWWSLQPLVQFQWLWKLLGYLLHYFPALALAFDSRNSSSYENLIKKKKC